MVVNFKNTSGMLFFNDFITPYAYYRLKLKSRYSNEYLMMGVNDYLSLTIDENYDEWCSFDFTGLEQNIPNKDIQGYYDVEVWGSNNNVDYTLLKKVLGKVINNFTTTNNTYVSDNENNEQYVYYRK